MLIKPDLKEEEIVKCLWDVYGLIVDKIFFLPLGADLNTAVYRVRTSTERDYFLKLRSGEFNDAAVLVPKCLADLGFKQVIPPLTTKEGQFWTSLASFKAVIYPYVEGRNSVEVNLSDTQWIELGATMKKFHSADIPRAITSSVHRETFSSKWRQTVKTFLRRIEEEVFEESIASIMASFLKSKRKEILELLMCAEHLAHMLQKQPLEYVLCHADIHGWNLLIDEEGALYVVDWDTLLFAPKERDLMFIGSGLGDSKRMPTEDEALFYQGYGPSNINYDALAYYRCERIIEDIGVYCEQIFLSDEGGEDRIQSFKYLQSNFLPNGTIERAFQSYKASENQE
ncbi:phosphotransferase enzyme family protein [Legionella sainthelensi]|uniref:phosphotransferase enzyme family protein n=1 Tax=Legionella sainthelensi TaxID=28087 RepID=UPI000E201D63|nr:aminoglycoside phosphotransferase family protein [Legionella sainthelensi]